ncbi:MAG: ATP-binding protein [bacterium]
MDIRSASRAAADLLQTEVSRLRSRGIAVGEDDLRGLYIADQEADRIIASAGSTEYGSAISSEAADLVDSLGERLTTLASRLHLSAPETAALALCFVAETDPEIERLIAYVQDDVSRKRPRVEMALRLLWGDTVASQASFDASAPLRKYRLVELHDDTGQPATPLLSRTLTLDPRVARYLAGGDALDDRLWGAATTVSQSEATARASEEPLLIDPRALEPAVISIRGTDSVRVSRSVMALAAAAGLAGTVELQFPVRELPAVEAFERGARDALLLSFAFLVRGVEALEEPQRSELVKALDSSIAPFTAIAWEGEPAWHGPSVVVPPLPFEGRLREWHVCLGNHQVARDVEEALPALAGKFELDSGAIEAATRGAMGLATARDAAKPEISVEDLYASARARSAPILSSLARKVTDHKRWEDLILEPDPMAQLHELCGMVEHRHRVYDEWGFGKKLSSGKGVVSLFAGQSGTGKTMGAGVIAAELGLDLYKIDLSGVVSKYIGETEKNLGAIFRDASLSNAILFFDEADALFGKRSEVRDAHDRYANIETAYLLQQIEEYEGPVILSTNLKMNLDEAFLRRMHFVVDFPMPEEPYRMRIWQTTVPDQAPLGPDVDFAFLARQFRISGGNIRNIVLAASFLAAQDGDEMCMRHFIRGTRREFQKLGRMVTEADFGEYLTHLD